jgi:RNA recognition motif-containing protein
MKFQSYDLPLRHYFHIFIITMNLYVGNLDFEITEEEIRSLFEQVGDVSSVRLMIDKETGRSKGFAFVEMGDTEEAVIALKTLNGREFHGRNIVVNQGTESSDKRSSNSDRSGDRGSYGDGQRRSHGDGERRSYGNSEKRPYSDERRPYGDNKRSDRGSFDSNDRRPSNNDSYDRRPSDNYSARKFDNDNQSSNRDGEVKKPSSEGTKRPRITDRSEDKKIQIKESGDDKKRFNDED